MDNKQASSGSGEHPQAMTTKMKSLSLYSEPLYALECDPSLPIDPRDYLTDHDVDLCSGFPVRYHRNSIKEAVGAIRAHQDWSIQVQRVKNYRGTLGNPLHFVSLTIPEALPERLEIISYANEYAFIYDGKITHPFSPLSLYSIARSCNASRHST